MTKAPLSVSQDAAELRVAPIVRALALNGRPIGLELTSDGSPSHNPAIAPLAHALGLRTGPAAPDGFARRTISGEAAEADDRWIDIDVQDRTPPDKSAGLPHHRPLQAFGFIGTSTAPAEKDGLALTRAFIAAQADGPQRAAFGAWSQDTFIIVACNPQARALIDDLAHASQAGDLAVWTDALLGQNGPSLKIARLSAIDDATRAKCAAIDRAARAKTRAAPLPPLDTGLITRLRATGEFETIETLPVPPERAAKTKSSVIYRLTPLDHTNKPFTATTEQLELWLARRAARKKH